MKQTISLLIFLIFSIAIFPSSAKAVVIFEERFNGSNLPSNWSFDTDGDWAIINQELAQQTTLTTPGHADAWAGSLGWADYSVETQFKFVEFGTNNWEAGLGIRHDQLSTGGDFVVSRVSWRGSDWTLEILRPLLPEIHVPLNQSLTTDEWYTMKAQIVGDVLDVWVNDTLYSFGNLTPTGAISSSGNIGLWANNAHVRYDNVIVDNLSPVPEPSSMMLMGIGALGGLALRKKKK